MNGGISCVCIPSRPAESCTSDRTRCYVSTCHVSTTKDTCIRSSHRCHVSTCNMSTTWATCCPARVSLCLLPLRCLACAWDMPRVFEIYHACLRSDNLRFLSPSHASAPTSSLSFLSPSRLCANLRHAAPHTNLATAPAYPLPQYSLSLPWS